MYMLAIYVIFFTFYNLRATKISINQSMITYIVIYFLLNSIGQSSLNMKFYMTYTMYDTITKMDNFTIEPSYITVPFIENARSPVV